MAGPSSSWRRLTAIGVATFTTFASAAIIGLIAPAQAVACPTPSTLPDGSFLVTITSDCSWTVPNGVTSIDLIVVGGGGGGGANAGGGGGGGGVLIQAGHAVTAGDVWAATIGAGGAGGSGGGGNGSGGTQSKLLKGGSALNAQGGNGGGGGGGGGGSSGTGTNSLNAGGAGDGANAGGGGGGSGSVGAAFGAGAAGGNGTTWTANGVAYGGGGGGGANGTSAGSGTAGGGSGSTSGIGSTGTANRGGGGGGGGPAFDGGAGSDGIILVNYAGSSPTITTTVLNDATVGQAYSATLAASGGSGVFTAWALSTGTLPTGLSLDSTSGVISGTPTAAGQSTFSVRATDSAGTQTAARSLTLTVLAPAKPVVTTSSLPDGTVGSAYTASLSASGGSGTFTTWALSSGSLPSGLSINASTGTISGTPTSSGTQQVAVTVTDSAGTTSNARPLSLSVVGLPTPSVTTTSLPDATAGSAYAQTLAASGGSGTYRTWTIASGALPPGLSLNSSTGTISGIAATPGSYAFGVTVTDSAGATSSTRTISLTVLASASPSRTPTPTVTPQATTPAPSPTRSARPTSTAKPTPVPRPTRSAKPTRNSQPSQSAVGGASQAPRASQPVAPSVTPSPKARLATATPPKGDQVLSVDSVRLQPADVPGEIILKGRNGQPLEVLSVSSTSGEVVLATTGADFNNPQTWQASGYGTLCWKLEPFGASDYTYTLPNPIQPPAGTPRGPWSYANVIVKAGSVTSDDPNFQVNTVFAKPAAGTSVFADGNKNGVSDPGGRAGDKSISHIIICASGGPDPAPNPSGSVAPTGSVPTSSSPSPESASNRGYVRNGKVTLCHRTSSRTNPYVTITVDANAVQRQGHGAHTGPLYPEPNWGDIIPPFDDYPGLNWPAGQAIYDSGCDATAPSTIRSPSPSASPGTVSPSPTGSPSLRSTNSAAPLPTNPGPNSTLPPTAVPPSPNPPSPGPSTTGIPAPSPAPEIPSNPPPFQPRIIVVPPIPPTPAQTPSRGDSSAPPGTPAPSTNGATEPPPSSIPTRGGSSPASPAASPTGTVGSGRGGTGRGGSDPQSQNEADTGRRGKGRYGSAVYSPEAWARYSNLPGEVTMVVTDGRSMVVIRQPMNVIAAVANGVAPPPTESRLADTGGNPILALIGGVVLMAIAILLWPVARRRPH